MGDVLEYSDFRARHRPTVMEPGEQFERVKADATAAIELARTKLAAARQRPGGGFIDDFVDGLDRVLMLLDGFDPALERDVAQLFYLRNLLHAMFAHLSQNLAAVSRPGPPWAGSEPAEMRQVSRSATSWCEPPDRQVQEFPPFSRKC